MIRFTCPQCQKRLKAADDSGGAKATCPKCRSKVLVPATIVKEATDSPSGLRVQRLNEPSLDKLPEALPAASHERRLPEHTEKWWLPASNTSLSWQVRVIASEDGKVARDEPLDCLPADPKEVLSDARLAIKKLRVRKRELSLAKRSIMQEQREIRAAYTDHVRRRGSKFIGGRGIGRFIRVLQTMDRDGKRRQLAAELGPLERRRAEIEDEIMEIDQAILRLQQAIDQLRS